MPSLACVARVSVGYSAGLKNFSLFGRAKIERAPSTFCVRPNFRADKKWKMPRMGGISYRNATQAMSAHDNLNCKLMLILDN